MTWSTDLKVLIRSVIVFSVLWTFNSPSDKKNFPESNRVRGFSGSVHSKVMIWKINLKKSCWHSLSYLKQILVNWTWIYWTCLIVNMIPILFPNVSVALQMFLTIQASVATAKPFQLWNVLNRFCVLRWVRKGCLD